MSAVVHRMPGLRCRLHHAGRCLYDERLNPGLRLDLRCVILLQWEEAYDTFLSQVDNFKVDPGTAGAVWQERLAGMMRKETDCPLYIPGGEDPVGCGHFFDGLCLQAFPKCEGICSRYEQQTEDD